MKTQLLTYLNQQKKTHLRQYELCCRKSSEGTHVEKHYRSEESKQRKLVEMYNGFIKYLEDER